MQPPDRPAQRLHEELYQVLRQFPLQHAQEHLLPEFSTTWEAVTAVLQRKRQAVKATTLAGLMLEIVERERYSEEQIEYALATLRIKCIALNEREWHMLRLSDPTFAESEPTNNTLSQMGARVGRALRDAYRPLGLTPEVHCVKMGRWSYMSVGLVGAGGRVKTRLYMAVPYGYSVVLLSKSAEKKLLLTIAQGLGYSSIADAKLSGRHIDSLLRVHEQETNTNVNNLLDKPPYEHKAVVTRDGIDFVNEEYNDAYVDTLLGPDPPILNAISMTTDQPLYCDATGDTMRIKLKITSDNIAETLRTMVRAKAIPANSVWFNIFTTMRSNELNDVFFEEAD